MKDRNVEFSQRYHLKKVDGTDDIYDIIPAPGEVFDEGTLINKNTLLKDATAALFGLGTNAVPDDVMRLISRFHKNLANEYLFASGSGYIVTGAKTVKTLDIDLAIYAYGDSVSLVDGKVVIDNEVELQAWEYGGSEAKNKELFALLDGKYFRLSNNVNESDIVYKFYSAAITDYYTMDATVSVMSVETGYTYYNSPDPNAYPESEGYLNLGRLGDGVRIATGSYTGTGKYGASNPCSLTFDFVPKFLFVNQIITPNKDNNGNFAIMQYTSPCFVYCDTSGKTYLHGSSVVTWSGNSVSWFNDINKTNGQSTSLCIQYQQNVSGAQYAYIAIG